VSPAISLVIPAHNEELLLPRLLDSVERARQESGLGRDELEIVVADNASTDRTAEIAAAGGCRVVAVEKRVIAAARNAGARASRGEIVCFTDADGVIHPRTFAAIVDAARAGVYVVGSTGVTMERWSPGIAVTFALLVPLVWCTSFDTGVVWCRRADFDAVGGFPESRRFAEDLAFQIALRRLGRATGRRPMRLRGVKTIASTRKFDRHGDWHYFTRMPPLVWNVLFRRGEMTEFAESYWYRPPR